MKVSLKFVSKFVDLSGLTPEEIAHRFTFAGVEVESIEKLASGTKLVVGEVLNCENMPDSDHLHSSPPQGSVSEIQVRSR